MMTASHDQKKIGVIKLKIVWKKEEPDMNEWFRVFAAQLHKVSVANTDVEKSLLRSFSSALRVPNPLSATPTKSSNTLKQFVGR